MTSDRGELVTVGVDIDPDDPPAVIDVCDPSIESEFEIASVTSCGEGPECGA